MIDHHGSLFIVVEGNDATYQEKLNSVCRLKIIDQKGGKGLEKGKCIEILLLKTRMAIYSIYFSVQSGTCSLLSAS